MPACQEQQGTHRFRPTSKAVKTGRDRGITLPLIQTLTVFQSSLGFIGKDMEGLLHVRKVCLPKLSQFSSSVFDLIHCFSFLRLNSSSGSSNTTLLVMLQQHAITVCQRIGGHLFNEAKMSMYSGKLILGEKTWEKEPCLH